MADRRSRPYRHHRGGGGWSNPQASRQTFRGHLEAGMRGFVCTTNNQEKACVREALELLNEYADLMFGREEWREPGDVATVEEGGEEEDVAEALQREVRELQAAQRRPPAQRRFRVLNSGAKNYVFIASTVADPVGLVHRLLSDLQASRQPRSRFLLRLLPVEASSRTSLEDITAAASKLFDKHFAEGNKSFAVIYRCRNNSGVSREALIDALAALVKEKNATNYANLSSPQLSVLVEIVRSVCLLSVVPDYFALAKYNVLEVALDKPGAADQQEGEGGGDDLATPSTSGDHPADLATLPDGDHPSDPASDTPGDLTTPPASSDTPVDLSTPPTDGDPNPAASSPKL